MSRMCSAFEYLMRLIFSFHTKVLQMGKWSTMTEAHSINNFWDVLRRSLRVRHTTSCSFKFLISMWWQQKHTITTQTTTKRWQVSIWHRFFLFFITKVSAGEPSIYWLLLKDCKEKVKNWNCWVSHQFSSALALK